MLAATLLTLAGWTSVEVAEAFGVTADSVRHWRQWFCSGGVEALRSTLAPGRLAGQGEQALAVAAALLREPVENRPHWTLPRLQAEIERQTGLSISTSRLSILLREKGGSAGAVPRHTLKGRQDAGRWSAWVCVSSSAVPRPRPAISFCFTATKARP